MIREKQMYYLSAILYLPKINIPKEQSRKLLDIPVWSLFYSIPYGLASIQLSKINESEANVWIFHVVDHLGLPLPLS